MSDRHEFGKCFVEYAEVDGLLVTHASAPHPTGMGPHAWTAGRSFAGIGSAVRAVIMGEFEAGEFGYSYDSEDAAIQAFRAMEDTARIRRNEDEGLCHCGHSFYGSDHCPLCGCEQWERYCEMRYHDSPYGRAHCDCQHHEGYDYYNSSNR